MLQMSRLAKGWLWPTSTGTVSELKTFWPCSTLSVHKVLHLWEWTRLRYIHPNLALSKWKMTHSTDHPKKCSKTSQRADRRRNVWKSAMQSTFQMTTSSWTKTTMAKTLLNCASMRLTKWSTTLQLSTVTPSKQPLGLSKKIKALNSNWQTSS